MEFGPGGQGMIGPAAACRLMKSACSGDHFYKRVCFSDPQLPATDDQVYILGSSPGTLPFLPQLSTLVFLTQLCRVQRWRLLAPAPALSCIPGIILITSPVNVKLVLRNTLLLHYGDFSKERKEKISGQINVFGDHKQACQRHF